MRAFQAAETCFFCKQAFSDAPSRNSRYEREQENAKHREAIRKMRQAIADSRKKEKTH